MSACLLHYHVVALNRVIMTPSDQWGLKVRSEIWWTRARLLDITNKRTNVTESSGRKCHACENVCVWTVMLPLWLAMM